MGRPKKPKPVTPPKPTPLCGSPKRKKPGQFCGNTAGKKTDHLGIGRCWLHGGRSGTLKHGLYSKVSRENYAKLIEEAKQHPDVGKLDDDVAFLTVLVGKVADLQGLPGHDHARYTALSEMVQRRIDALKTKAQIEQGFAVRLTQTNLETVVTNLEAVIREFVSDPAILQKIGARLRERSGL